MDARRQTTLMTGALVALLLMPAGVGAQQQGARPPGTHQDNTDGKEWIRRLERPERIPGLKIPEVIASLGLKPGDVIADIGAGTGTFAIPFAKAVAPSGRAYAVDIWPDLLDYIKVKAAKEGVSTLDTVLAAREDPRLPKRQVDVVFFHDVFHNANDRADYLTRVAGALKPGGRIAIVEQEYRRPHREEVGPPGRSHHARAGEGMDGDGGVRTRRRVRHVLRREEPAGHGHAGPVVRGLQGARQAALTPSGEDTRDYGDPGDAPGPCSRR